MKAKLIFFPPKILNLHNLRIKDARTEGNFRNHVVQWSSNLLERGQVAAPIVLGLWWQSWGRLAEQVVPWCNQISKIPLVGIGWGEEVGKWAVLSASHLV